jgi:acid phosphatase (class A)
MILGHGSGSGTRVRVGISEVFMRRGVGIVFFLLVLAPAIARVHAAAEHSGPLAAVDPVAVIGQPPASGSDEAKADLAIVLWLQRTRTPDQVARARNEVKIGLETFATVLGPGFDPAAHPRTQALVERLHAEASALVDQARSRFARGRPFVADRRVEPAVKADGTPSYPSSHGTRGILYARVLAELAPGQRDALLEVGRRVGYDRVLGGVHYPSDVLAGQRLGEALADALLAMPAFRTEMAEIRATEWVRATR